MAEEARSLAIQCGPYRRQKTTLAVAIQSVALYLRGSRAPNLLVSQTISKEAIASVFGITLYILWVKRLHTAVGKLDAALSGLGLPYHLE
jgi:hypothetical protein